MPVSPTEIRDWTIYKITNPKARVYIGITSNFYSRMSCYKSQDKRLSRQTLIYNSMRKYGYDGHTIEVIDTFTIGIPKLGIFRALSGKYKQSRGFIFKYKQP
jgi:hypothetical protein